MIYSDRFSYTPADKTLVNEPDCTEGGEIMAAVIGLIHAETVDEKDPLRVEKKLIKKVGYDLSIERKSGLHTSGFSLLPV